jgi:hypothetical protein
MEEGARSKDGRGEGTNTEGEETRISLNSDPLLIS